MIVGFDLDSTLADTTPRAHLIDREHGTDWEAYAMACENDEEGPAYWLAMTFAEAGAKLVIASARHASARIKTERWLDRVKLSKLVYEIVLADDAVELEDFAGHVEWKAHAIDELDRLCMEKYGEGISLYVDDWPQCKEAIERVTGIPTLVVYSPNSFRSYAALMSEPESA